VLGPRKARTRVRRIAPGTIADVVYAQVKALPEQLAREVLSANVRIMPIGAMR
jgi:hypothetical protein